MSSLHVHVYLHSCHVTPWVCVGEAHLDPQHLGSDGQRSARDSKMKYLEKKTSFAAWRFTRRAWEKWSLLVSVVVCFVRVVLIRILVPDNTRKQTQGARVGVLCAIKATGFPDHVLTRSIHQTQDKIKLCVSLKTLFLNQVLGNTKV